MQTIKMVWSRKQTIIKEELQSRNLKWWRVRSRQKHNIEGEVKQPIKIMEETEANDGNYLGEWWKV